MGILHCALQGLPLITTFSCSKHSHDPIGLAKHPFRFVLVIALIRLKRANQICCSGFWRDCHFLMIMLIRWLVIRKQMLYCALFSVSSFICLDFLPFFESLSFCPWTFFFSLSLNLGWKRHCWVTFHREKWNENVSHFSFCFFLPPSLLRRPPNQAWKFPRPLYNCCTIRPIVQLFFCVSLDPSSLCLFVSHVGDRKKDPASSPSSRSLFLPWPCLVPYL